MHSIRLNDQVYVKAQQVAAARGFGSVEDFIAQVVDEESKVEAGDFDHLFTPEIIAAIDEGVADADAGRVHTVAEVRKHFEEKSKAWQRDHAS